jgi:16S rRNA processing protein RimM
MQESRICVGAFAGAHGVRGLLKVKSFTEDPKSLVAYGPATDETGRRRFEMEFKGESKGLLLVRIDGIADREAAQALKGQRLYVPRSVLPEPAEEEFYFTDLVGLSAFDRSGLCHGTVKAVQNYGAGDFLEIADKGGSELLLPFTKQAVPEVDVKGGRLLIVPSQEVTEGDGPEE